jgi:glycosyltransferase involved in cell wall biosynthesis
MSRKRLLVISHDFSLTGAPIALLNLLAGLRDKFQITVVAPGEDALRPQFEQLGFETSLHIDLIREPNITAELMQNHDLLLANTLVSFNAIHGAARAGKPSMWIIHEGYAWQRFMTRFAPQLPDALELATMVCMPCEFGRRLYKTWRTGPIEVVYWGVEPPMVDGPRFNFAPPEEQGAQVTPLEILQLGTYAERKGQDIAMNAMQRLDDGRCFLNIVGKIDSHDFYYAVSTQYAAVKHAGYRGEVSRDMAATMLAACDMLIVPSRDEMTPLVILDAMALGKPVIAADVGGIPEMITDGETGFLFPPEDAAELARLIRRVGGDGALRRRVGERARRFVLEQRRPQQCVERYAQILSGLLGVTQFDVRGRAVV